MFDNLQEIWQRRSASARAGLVFGVLLIAALLVWLGMKVLQRDYQVLFSGLEPQDAATIVAELDKMKVPYRTGADETTLLVESTQVHPTRLKLMGKGVNLRGGVGFEISSTAPTSASPNSRRRSTTSARCRANWRARSWRSTP